MNRRSFLRNTLAGTTAIAVTPSAFLASCGPDGTDALDKALIGTVGGVNVVVPPLPFTTPFSAPQVKNASSVVVEASNNNTVLVGINQTFCYGYTSSIWGPTLKISAGNAANITFENSINENSNIHFHGLALAANVDGNPDDVVSFGGSKSYAFDANSRAGLYWYHPQTERSTGKQINLGLGGLFVIDGGEEGGLGLPNIDESIFLVLQDKRFNDSDTLFYGPSTAERIAGYFGEHMMVNGLIGPFKNVATKVVRLRIVNASNARIMNLGFDCDNPDFGNPTMIGNDGGLLPNSATSAQIMLAPGERIDLLVDFRPLNVGDIVTMKSKTFGGGGKYQGSESFEIMQFVVNNATVDGYTIPGSLATIPVLTEADATNTRSLDISNKNINSDEAYNDPEHIHGINGDSYDPNVVNYTIDAGTTELWEISNDGADEPRAIHISGAKFQIISRVGGRDSVKQWEEGWKDTVLLLPDETVQIVIPFGMNLGKYFVYCTNLEMADSGLMHSYEIV
ncbi:MAG: multicopper oxidase domain-containing protein [Chitinophagales bacterium]